MNEGNKPIVSVLMIAYNREQYIEEALEGVLRQKTTFPFEIIIGEDCSTDNTLAICRKYKKLYPNVINLIENEQNLGLQRNYIKAFKAAKGKYIAMCDPDDYWINKNKLQLQYDFLEKNQSFSLCFHRVLNYYENDGSKSLSNGGQKKITTILDLSASNYISNVSVFFRNNLFELPASGIETFAYFDYLLHMLCAEKGDIYYFNKVMAVYRKHSTGISSEENREKALRESILVRQFLRDHFKSNEVVSRNLKNGEAAIFNSLYQRALQRGEAKKAEQFLEELNQLHPEWLLSQKSVKTTTTQQINRKVKTILSSIRSEISKLFPLPKVR